MESKKGETAERTQPEKTWSIKDVDYVYNNYGQMTVTEIADARNLATFQVNQIITGLRKRNVLAKKRINTQGSIIEKFITSLSKKKQ